MENNKNIKEVEDTYKSKIYDLEAEPPTAAWDNIFARIQEPKKEKRPFAFWWGVSLLGLLALGSLLLWLNVSDFSTQHQSANETLPRQSTAQDQERTTTNTKVKEASSLSNISREEVQLSGKNTENNQSENLNTGINTSTSTNNRKMDGHSKGYKSQLGSVKAPELPNVKAATDQTSLDKKPNETIIAAEEVVTIPKEYESMLLREKAMKALQLSQALTMLNTHLTELETPTHIEKLKPITVKRARKQVKCFNFMKYNKLSYLSGYASGGYGLRTLNAKAPEHKDYLNLRKTTETSDYFIGAGVEFAHQFNKYWLVRAGVDVQQQEETFRIVNPAFTKEVITRYEDATTGQVTYDTTTQVGLYEERHINRYRSLSVPLMLGYDFAKNSSGITIYAGGSLQLLATQSGTIFDEVGQKTNLQAGTPATAFKTNIGFNAQISAQGYLYLNKDYRVFAEPFIQHRFGSITKDNNPIAQKYTYFGCKVGISKLLY